MTIVYWSLVSMIEYLLSVLPRSGQVDAVYLDFSKAFDRVDHNLLIAKLHQMGVSGSLLSWIGSYLQDRTQTLKLGTHESRAINVTSGVPQGSHLGSLLFAVFGNGIYDLLTDSEFLLYADDLKLLRKVTNQDDVDALQRCLTAVSEWCSNNKMSLNVNKCKVISFSRRAEQNRLTANYTIGSQVLTRTSAIRDLGVIVDSGLTLKPHINQVVCQEAVKGIQLPICG